MEFDTEFYEQEPDVLVDYEEDRYPPVRDEDYDYEDFLRNNAAFAPFTFDEILENCILPTSNDGLKYVGPMIFWCLVFRILTQCFTNFPPWLKHCTSIACGVIVAHKFFSASIIYLLGFTVLSYNILGISHIYVEMARGPLAVIFCTSFNMICELFFATPVEWHQIRGAQMALTMKLISVAYDMDEDVQTQKNREKALEAKNKIEENDQQDSDQFQGNSKKLLRKRKFFEKKANKEPVKEEPPEEELILAKMPSIFEYFGYALCPGTTVFGPWVSYKEYMDIFKTPKWNFAWLLKVIFSMGFGFMFLALSTCLITWFIPRQEQSEWIAAYRDAMSFRASHYFVSFISTASAVASGFGSTANSPRWEVKVAEPHNIEVPRSLVEVVVSWNVPMHIWLKKYCYKKTVAYGKLFAIMSTFFASTFLHGLNFQLGAVLLSLGFFSYVEDKFRSRISALFDASLVARRHPKDNFKHQEGSFMVMLINGGFGVLTVIHLMYLGVMFDQSDLQTEGYRWTHTIAKWQALGFFSHIFMAIMFVLSFII